MARLTAAARRALPKSDFAVPSKAPGPGSYPEPDKAHATDAAAMASRYGSAKVKTAVKKKARAKGFTPMHKQIAAQMLDPSAGGV